MDSKRRLETALQQTGFDDWVSPLEVPNLQRPRVRPIELPGIGSIGSVLLLFFPLSATTIRSYIDQHEIEYSGEIQDQLGLVLTRRAANLSHHANQISFPGGRRDGAESLAETALRETKEEMGVESQLIDLLGTLRSIYIPPSDFTVHSFVGWASTAPEFRPNGFEVDRVILTSMNNLSRSDQPVWCDVQNQQQPSIRVPCFKLNQHRCWGATAIILSELIQRFRRTSPFTNDL